MLRRSSDDDLRRQPRASARVALAVKQRRPARRAARACTKRARCACAFPTRRPSELEAVIVNTAGGIAGGDRFDARHRGRGRARSSSVTTAAAEKVYRSLGPDADDRREARCRGGRVAALAAAGDDPVRPRAAVAQHRGRARRRRARCSWPRRSCSAAPAWAKRWSRARCSTAGASGATAGWSLPRRCGSTARSRSALARASGRARAASRSRPC